MHHYHILMGTTMFNTIIAAAVLLFFALPADGFSQKQQGNAMPGFYTFTMKTIEGKSRKLADYKGSVLLVVNTASECGYTRQYETLEKLYLTYKDRGLKILAFPANNFGGQEPGSDEEIKTFCSTRFNVTFDLFSKISVKGSDMHPLYAYLTTKTGFDGDIKWNFNKFLVGRDGTVAARYDSKVEPLSKELIAKLEELLGK
jgi:glutathione peroxidase